jgi:hypothetical protein
MQLVAYGAQDVYLTGNPQITFFKVVYRRHTNFSVECIEQTFNGTADFGRTVTCNISRNGDLVTKMYLKIDLEETTAGKADHSDQYSFVENLGHAVVESAKVEIGGSKIDEHYGDWLNIWNELARNNSHDRGYGKMVGNVTELREFSRNKKRYSMYVPMQFWFCRNNGLALPLIALQYHDVRVTFKFRDVAQCININNGKPRNDVKFKDATLLIDYVYLDSEERKRFAQASHEYLIEQLQFTGEESVNTTNEKFRLNFNHPCKALYWSLRMGNYTTGKSVVSLADNGEVDIDRFCKIVWLATRQGITADGSQIDVTGQDEIANPNNVPDAQLSANLRSLVGTGGAASDGIQAQLVTASGTGLANADLDNVVIISRGDVDAATVSRMSVDSLKKDVNTGNGVSECFDRFARNLRQHSNYGLYVDGTENPVMEAKLQLNGHDRFSKRDGHYFNYVQPHQHFSNTPADGINVYSFALNPEEHQPSGTCNMSRIDNATLSLTLGERNAASSRNFADEYLVDDTVCSIYTVNYNVLRIMSGMGGLAYSN